MELEGKGNAITSTTTMVLTKSLEVKPNTNRPGREPYPDPEAKPESDPFPAVKKETQKQSTRGDQAAKYKECQKNHAAFTGGHVVDGCCEFMAGDEDGKLGALKCAACNCHRSFHRKELYGHRSSKQELISPAFYCSNNSSYMEMQPRGGYPMVEIGRRTSSSSEDMKKILSHRNQNLDVIMRKKKRVRTKISEEQKEKMKEFAEKLRWSMQKKDEEEIDKFCKMVNLRRQVFKVWMHNNKQAMKRNNNTNDLQK